MIDLLLSAPSGSLILTKSLGFSFFEWLGLNFLFAGLFITIYYSVNR